MVFVSRVSYIVDGLPVVALCVRHDPDQLVEVVIEQRRILRVMRSPRFNKSALNFPQLGNLPTRTVLTRLPRNR